MNAPVRHLFDAHGRALCGRQVTRKPTDQSLDCSICKRTIANTPGRKPYMPQREQS